MIAQAGNKEYIEKKQTEMIEDIFYAVINAQGECKRKAKASKPEHP